MDDKSLFAAILGVKDPCATHGIRQVRVPWAEEKSRFTALFEALAIDWMKHAAIATVAARLGVSWDEAAAIPHRQDRSPIS